MKWVNLTKPNPPVIFLISLYLVYFIFWWLYKLAIMPGLHGDEAWAGLKAIDFKKNHIHQLSGMNHYTGILQPYFSSIAFSWFGKGVFQLRIIGPVFNFIGLLILFFIFKPAQYLRVTLILFSIIAQSVFLLITPRIAWEVNSFTLFFISLLLFAVRIIQTNKNSFIQRLGYALFLIVNILGTYNHVIFSCVSIAGLLGLLFWSLHNKSLEYKNLIILCSINALNLLLLFYGMQAEINKLVPVLGYVILIIFFLIIFELYLLYRLTEIKVNNFQITISPFIFTLLSIIFINCFAYFHGVAFFQLVTNNKVLLHFFSYDTNFVQSVLYIICGCTYLLFLIKFLIQDILNPAKAIFAWVIISYFGLFSLYTTNCSFRYYLSILIISSVYIALKFNQHPKGIYIFYIIMTLTTLSINKNLFDIFINEHRIVKPVYFNMGNGVMETSAHFLPNKPVIDFLKRNKTQVITYGSNRYFLEQPIKFYYSIKPWVKTANKAATIDYDFESFGNGYQLFNTSY
ncbi:hypothetical protein [Mucilaginibacter sp. UYCu711]|uniref:hypothetical protein n=1 Tax=Mucilaginibacter sp. UYCu711 TaxID=3156339 RepID=UPI003D1E0A60